MINYQLVRPFVIQIAKCWIRPCFVMNHLLKNSEQLTKMVILTFRLTNQKRLTCPQSGYLLTKSQNIGYGYTIFILKNIDLPKHLFLPSQQGSTDNSNPHGSSWIPKTSKQNSLCSFHWSQAIWNISYSRSSNKISLSWKNGVLWVTKFGGT